MDFDSQRSRLISNLKASSITNNKVLQAIQTLPREQFVLEKDQALAYENHALPILCHQTISQPYIIALMTQALLEVSPMQKVLEIGTGSGYQTAILSKVVDKVYSIERIKTLHQSADQRLKELKLTNIETRLGDGYQGWPEEAPFDGILVTAATDEIPKALLDQLRPNGGRLVIPVGEPSSQQLLAIDRHQNNYHRQILEYVQFVPLLPGTE